jgi:hypothetical protein
LVTWRQRARLAVGEGNLVAGDAGNSGPAAGETADRHRSVAAVLHQAATSDIFLQAAAGGG